MFHHGICYPFGWNVCNILLLWSQYVVVYRCMLLKVSWATTRCSMSGVCGDRISQISQHRANPITLDHGRVTLSNFSIVFRLPSLLSKRYRKLGPDLSWKHSVVGRQLSILFGVMSKRAGLVFMQLLHLRMKTRLQCLSFRAKHNSMRGSPKHVPAYSSSN